MKRTNIIFTCISISVIVGMLINIRICWSMKHLSAPASIELTKSLYYIPPIIIVDIIWKVMIRKAKSACAHSHKGSRGNNPKKSSLKLVNFAFTAIDLLIIVTAVIHITVLPDRYQFSPIRTDSIIYYLVPVIIVNELWFVFNMNLSQTLARNLK